MFLNNVFDELEKKSKGGLFKRSLPPTKEDLFPIIIQLGMDNSLLERNPNRRDDFVSMLKAIEDFRLGKIGQDESTAVSELENIFKHYKLRVKDFEGLTKGGGYDEPRKFILQVVKNFNDEYSQTVNGGKEIDADQIPFSYLLKKCIELPAIEKKIKEKCGEDGALEIKEILEANEAVAVNELKKMNNMVEIERKKRNERINQKREESNKAIAEIQAEAMANRALNYMYNYQTQKKPYDTALGQAKDDETRQRLQNEIDRMAKQFHSDYKDIFIQTLQEVEDMLKTAKIFPKMNGSVATLRQCVSRWYNVSPTGKNTSGLISSTPGGADRSSEDSNTGTKSLKGTLKNLDTDKFAEDLKKRIHGQEEAIDAAKGVIENIQLRGKRKGKPIGYMMFDGPTSVGKTALTEAIANAGFGGNLIRVDLGTVATSGASFSDFLRGSSQGYRDSGEASQFMKDLENTPKPAVILFDEIEKAIQSSAARGKGDGTSALAMFLEFDAGKFTDGMGKVWDLSDYLIICTTNATARADLNDNERPKRSIGFGSGSQLETKVVKSKEEKHLDELYKTFSPEFLARFGEIIRFESLTSEAARKIVEDAAKNDVKNFKNDQADNGTKNTVEYSDSFIDYVVDNSIYSGPTGSGGRALLKTFEKASSKVINQILKKERPTGKNIIVSLNDEGEPVASIAPTV